MTLLDTNVLVALVDERDQLHARAKRDLKTVVGPFGLTSVVLCESCFLLPQGYLRQRLRFLLDRLGVSPVDLDPSRWGEIFDWLARYAQHEPDWCDAELVVLAGRERSSIWTYDKEFRTLWRAPDGRSLKVVPGDRKSR